MSIFSVTIIHSNPTLPKPLALSTNFHKIAAKQLSALDYIKGVSLAAGLTTGIVPYLTSKSVYNLQKRPFTGRDIATVLRRVVVPQFSLKAIQLSTILGTRAVANHISPNTKQTNTMISYALTVPFQQGLYFNIVEETEAYIANTRPTIKWLSNETIKKFFTGNVAAFTRESLALGFSLAYSPIFMAKMGNSIESKTVKRIISGATLGSIGACWSQWAHNLAMLKQQSVTLGKNDSYLALFKQFMVTEEINRRQSVSSSLRLPSRVSFRDCLNAKSFSYGFGQLATRNLQYRVPVIMGLSVINQICLGPLTE
ncbi:hypothetical protein DID75_05870 [Candidatus Marinamargulisbacteria bacterium SCGC AG-410-N11]|nr:hypothetical protein DID75_05870 [Candidatus Marinamargulisbacteria bacterium SCGC AG-410-N11]